MAKLTRQELRQAKFNRLEQLLTVDVNATYNQLNDSLKQEFGSGLRKQDLLKFRRDVKELYDFAKAPPKKVKVKRVKVDEHKATQKRIYNSWRRAGFLPEEAHELTYGKRGVKVNSEAVYKSKPARLARANRRRMIEVRLKAGATKRDINRHLRKHYQARIKDKISVWDFIRKEYRQVTKLSPVAFKQALKDFRAKARAEATKKVRSVYQSPIRGVR